MPNQQFDFFFVHFFAFFGAFSLLYDKCCQVSVFPEMY